MICTTISRTFAAVGLDIGYILETRHHFLANCDATSWMRGLAGHSINTQSQSAIGNQIPKSYATDNHELPESDEGK